MVVTPFVYEKGDIFPDKRKDWREQSRKLKTFMLVWAEKLNIYKNKDMILPWTLRVRVFIQKEVPFYIPRLRTQSDTLKQIQCLLDG